MTEKTKRDDGGQAFPVPAGGWSDNTGVGNGYGDGMSLRDYFAGQALAGLLANSQIAKDMVKEKIGPINNQAWHADTAYQFADAMIVCRKLK